MSKFIVGLYRNSTRISILFSKQELSVPLFALCDCRSLTCQNLPPAVEPSPRHWWLRQGRGSSHRISPRAGLCSQLERREIVGSCTVAPEEIAPSCSSQPPPYLPVCPVAIFRLHDSQLRMVLCDLLPPMAMLPGGKNTKGPSQFAELDTE